MNRLGTAALYVVAAAVMLFVLAPLVITVAISFSNSPFVEFPPHGFTWSWYGRVFENPQFQSSLVLSLLLALAATIGALLLGMPAAFAVVRRRFPGRIFCRTLLLSPLIFPAFITGLALLQLSSQIGSDNARLNLLIAHILITMPYIVRTVAASLEQVDDNLEDAARTLGASSYQTLRRVTIPQILPGITAGMIFAFMVSFDDFPVSMWLADARNTPMPILIYQLVARIFDPTVATISTLMMVLSIVAVIAIERFVGLRRAMGT